VKPTDPARTLAAVAVMAGLALAAIAAVAQTPPPGPPPGGMNGARDRLPTNDAEFVRAFDAANSDELDMAKYLVNRTQDPAVHAFAQHMIDDHSTAAVKLEAATRGTNLVPVPREMYTNRLVARGMAILLGEDGTQRDNDYMRLQVPAHRRALALVQWEADNGTNAGLKAFAASMVGTVQQHLQLAEAFLASHNLTPYAPPPPGPVPGHVNPNAMPGTGTSGQNNGTAPSPAPSASPHV
jgi:putative membrane protein